MTRRIIGGPEGTSSIVTQNNSYYVPIAETTAAAGSVNSFSGMANPQMIDGTTTVTFANIPQTYRDLKIQFSYMSHNTVNGSQYRITWWYNGDTTNNRYYSRGGTQATGTPGHNSDNTDRHYFMYCRNHTQTSWGSIGDITIPNYSTACPSNFRHAMGNSWNLNSLDYAIPWGFHYYNNVAAALPVTRLDFSWEGDVKFKAISKITLYGIGIA